MASTDTAPGTPTAVAAASVPSPSPTPATRAAAEMNFDELGSLFGIDDLADRLNRVDDLIMATLDAGGALLGPATVRVASAGGKRLRPLLTIVCAAVGDRFDDDVVASAAAVELVQAGSLVHDDILDEADSRRGRPTINAVEGISHAVLAGDYMLARAAELAAGVSQEAARVLARTIGELCEGQVLEMRDSFDPGRTEEASMATIRGKTAALFECACRLGALCGDLPPAGTDALGRYGDAFGLSFQLLDDVLDLVADADRLGKPTGNDLLSGVYTLPVLTALDGPRGAELRALLPDPATGQRGNVPKAIEVILGSGAVHEALATMDRYADTARQAVAHLDQTTVGEGLAAFPHRYNQWALARYVDQSLVDVPLAS